MVYYAFDLLHLDGFDTPAAPLIERQRVLKSLRQLGRFGLAARGLCRRSSHGVGQLNL
jgi:ATP-dependent DNA ligase